MNAIIEANQIRDFLEDLYILQIVPAIREGFRVNGKPPEFIFSKQNY